MNLHTLSSTLVGIQKQVLSYRRDAADKDYPSEFYENYLDPDRKLLDTLQSDRSALKASLMQKRPKYVLMERSYLNSWTKFSELTK